MRKGLCWHHLSANVVVPVGGNVGFFFCLSNMLVNNVNAKVL